MAQKARTAMLYGSKSSSDHGQKVSRASVAPCPGEHGIKHKKEPPLLAVSCGGQTSPHIAASMSWLDIQLADNKS